MKKIFTPLLFLIFSASTFAANSTANMKTSGSIQKTCSVSATPINFDTYSAATNNTMLYNTGNITVRCNKAAAAIMLNSGQSGDVKARKMYNATNILHYQLYTSNNYDVVWSDQSWYTGSDYIYLPHDSGLSTAKNYTVYARMSGQQYVKPGIYTDSITVSVQY